jgi:hypothetical protein
MVLILRTQRLVISLLEISRFNLSKDFSGLLQMHFGELKMHFIPTAPIRILCYIRNSFDCLEFSKCVFIWNMIYYRCPLVCLKSYHHRNIDQLTVLKLVTYRSFVWYINMVLILRTEKVEKSLLEISRFNLWTDFVCVLKTDFASWKSVFWKPLQFTYYATYKTFLTL